ncbi:hypothetical protein MMC30_001188 [Trapelia coarctata]|nr:hypothetical protein [Trapelia coarctata]
MPSARKRHQLAQRKMRTTDPPEIIQETPELALLDLPNEILSHIFEHLLVLPKESHFRDPGTNSHPIYKATRTYRIIKGLYYPHFPPNPNVLDTGILIVCKALTPIAEHVLYAQNMFAFQTAQAIEAFAKKVNTQTTSMALFPRTGLIRKMKLYCYEYEYNWDYWVRMSKRWDMEYLIRAMSHLKHARDEGYKWDQYFDSGSLVKDFPGLVRLETHFPLGSSIWLWEGKLVHPAMVVCHPC